ncbi:MAG: tRNA uracil 4-sulfurtransferase ThiI [Candidatus Bathyarchaeota archaeon]
MKTGDGTKMGDEVILITYSEIGLKSAPVRKVLEHQLVRQIATSLKLEGFADFKVRRLQGRLIVEGRCPEEIAETAAKVFGVASAIPAIKIASNMEAVVQTALEVAFQNIKDGQAFAVRARRTGEQPYTSRDIQVRAGEEILRCLKPKGVKVDLDNPDVTINVEARDGDAYIYHRVIEGPRGFPFGSQGRLISLFSGGIDSPAAAWLMMKRGANVKLLFIDQRPFVGDDYYLRALKVAERLRRYVPLKDYVMLVAPMGEIMYEITKNIPARFTCLVCKRMMYRIACGLAERMRLDGIVTGESLGQVASQTLANLKVLDEVATLPVYRPLIGFEKMEIVELAKLICTYEASISSIHGCSAVPARPATKAELEDILDGESCLPVNRLVSDALEKVSHVKM